MFILIIGREAEHAGAGRSTARIGYVGGRLIAVSFITSHFIHLLHLTLDMHGIFCLKNTCETVHPQLIPLCSDQFKPLNTSNPARILILKLCH